MCFQYKLQLVYLICALANSFKDYMWIEFSLLVNELSGSHVSPTTVHDIARDCTRRRSRLYKTLLATVYDVNRECRWRQ